MSVDNNSGAANTIKMTMGQILDMFGAFPDFEIPVESPPQILGN